MTVLFFHSYERLSIIVLYQLPILSSLTRTSVSKLTICLLLLNCMKNWRLKFPDYSGEKFFGKKGYFFQNTAFYLLLKTVICKIQTASWGRLCCPVHIKYISLASSTISWNSSNWLLVICRYSNQYVAFSTNTNAKWYLEKN